MTKPIEAVVFDVGNVLAKVSYDRIAAKLALHSPLAPDAIAGALIGGDIEADAETGKYDSREHFRRIKERIRGAADWDYATFVEEFRSGLEMTAAGEAAGRHAAERARVFLMSDTSYLHGVWIFQQEVLATLPEQLFFSFREGYMKTDPRIWEVFFERTRVPPERCLFVDDKPVNCRIAAAAGVNTITFRIDEMDLIEELAGWL